MKQESISKAFSWESAWKTVSQGSFWQFSLIFVGYVSSLVYPHAPLVGFSAVAGNTLTRKKALTCVMAIWLANQLYGFIIRQYPQTWESFTWGIVMGLGTLFVTGLVTLRPTFCQRFWGHCLWLVISVIGGYLLYQGAIIVFAQLMGGHSLTLAILWRIFLKNCLWGIGLSLIHGCVVGAMMQFFPQYSSQSADKV
ncbi:hypothetical protein cce_4820 [Crocosphaera subtropica ATCC 51142]|uniref:Uncharacterized protein n=1 Tax=Crocosphaera subtropica (strain ATCC 51142 / BH68) TaxID=43989 RepID=B1X207_CROS5|nr:hypothetical protein [Crocosphaera subtropica]ACB54168.1 hypothetical protein cce_4820 [Crocosphaera subtropica ATCC 51142]